MRLWAVWILLGLLMIGTAGIPPVNRTQEARVLETAREMIGQPVQDWLIPKLNGNLRLRKPPLAYWASAASMSAFGQNELAGRLPTVLLSWLTLGATYWLAGRWFNTRAALLSAASLLGTWLFFKHGLLAETDAYITALLTLGVYAIIRAEDSPKRDWPWLQAVAVCLAGMILAKGPPAVYLLIFWIARSAARRDWRLLRQFFTRGAILTTLILAVPWFIYIARHTTAEGQLGADLTNSADGGDHPGPPWEYVPMLFKATLPWTGVWLAALLMAGLAMMQQFKRRRRLFWSSGWMNISLCGLAVLVPLCAWGNKQFHYLQPIMPPTMILVGWALARATRQRPSAKAASIAATVTGFVLMAAAPAVLIGSRKLESRIGWDDVAMALLLIIAAVAMIWIYRTRGRLAAAVALSVLAILSMFTLHAWLPANLGGRSRLAALEMLKDFPDGRFVFRTTELPVMSWSMRRAVPTLDDAGILAATEPNLVILDQQTDVEAASIVPTGFVEAKTIKQGDNILHVYIRVAR
jgi:4-amino-4-deoxy-L-arabinose transferase-like glycosyltransferase